MEQIPDVATTIMSRSGPWVEVEPGLHVMNPFVVQMTFKGFEGIVEFTGVVEDGNVACSELRFIRANNGPSISAEWFRLFSFKELWRTATLMASYRSVAGGGRVPVAGSDFEIQDQAAAALVPRRKHRITKELLASVAEIYKENEESGWPTKAVAEKFNISRSTAATWVGLARKPAYGLLEPIDKSKRGPKS